MTLKVIVKGKAQGQVMKSKNPINFLGAVDKKTGKIRDEKHDLFGKSLANKILVFPFGVGSSVGAYTIYSLKSNNCAPHAMICSKVDITTASGCALANIPLVMATKEEYDSLKDGKKILLDAENGKIL
jgi:predicted aconitase with swiveling domain